MVIKSTDKARKVKENGEGKEQKGGRIKTLDLKRETVKNLSKKEQRGVMGASLRRTGDGNHNETLVRDTALTRHARKQHDDDEEEHRQDSGEAGEGQGRQAATQP